MPHKCTNCEYVIPDESEDLLSGCPDCGTQSWEYVVEKEKKENNKKDNVNNKKEDESQKAARTEFVDSNNLPSANIVEGLQAHTKTVDNISKIQEQLNNQYEGIQVVRSGKYKINLTELYRGNDYIIELDDNGSYTVKKATEL